MAIGKLSGAVGTYSTQTEQVEVLVCKRLHLTPETVATQVIPRDRHAVVMSALALLGGALERLAIELRHLQRTEVGEVVEGFTPGQKGSSAMPHKKNPISSENVTGCARMLRSYSSAAMENIALWHERDISHSAVERVFFPDAFILADYATDRMATVINGLYVDRERMRRNIEFSQGQVFSSHLLLALVEKGLSREDAYARVQSLSHSLKAGETLATAAGGDADVSKRLSKQELHAVFSGERHIQAIRKNLARLGFGSKEERVSNDDSGE
jgi:adenylosuccinate lyase